MKVNGSWIVLEELNDLMINQFLWFNFKSNNNQAKYEAIISSMSLDIEMDVSSLKASNDS